MLTQKLKKLSGNCSNNYMKSDGTETRNRIDISFLRLIYDGQVYIMCIYICFEGFLFSHKLNKSVHHTQVAFKQKALRSYMIITVLPHIYYFDMFSCLLLGGGGYCSILNVSNMQ